MPRFSGYDVLGGGSGGIEEYEGTPTTGSAETLYLNTDNPTDLYYFYGGHRYKLVSTHDDPVASGGYAVGLLLTLSTLE